MTRLAQSGIFCTVAGVITLFLGLFPGAVDADRTAGIGLLQILIILFGLAVLILGAYITVFALIHRGQPRNLWRDIGTRTGITGLLFASAAIMADLLGFGSHAGEEGVLMGWLQALGVLIGFLVSSIGVLIYGSVRYPDKYLKDKMDK